MDASLTIPDAVAMSVGHRDAVRVIHRNEKATRNAGPAVRRGATATRNAGLIVRQYVKVTRNAGRVIHRGDCRRGHDRADRLQAVHRNEKVIRGAVRAGRRFAAHRVIHFAAHRATRNAGRAVHRNGCPRRGHDRANRRFAAHRADRRNEKATRNAGRIIRRDGKAIHVHLNATEQ